MLLLLADLAVATAATGCLALLLASLTFAGQAWLLASVPRRSLAPTRALRGDDDPAGALVAFMLKGYGMALVVAHMHAWFDGPLATYALALMLELLRHDQSLHGLLKQVWPPDPLDCGFACVLLPCLCAPALALHGFGGAWLAFLSLGFLWCSSVPRPGRGPASRPDSRRELRGVGSLSLLGSFATLALAYALSWAVGLFAIDAVVDFGLGQCVLVGSGAAMLLACPRSLALGLLPLALARCVLGPTYAPAAYAPAAARGAAARGAADGLALGLRALRHARNLACELAWRVLSKLPTPTEWLRWGGEACGAALWAAGRSLSLGTQVGWWAVEAVARAVSLAGTTVGVRSAG